MRISGEHVVLRDEPEAGDREDMFGWLNMEEWAYYDHPDQPFEHVTREEYEERLRSGEAGGRSRVWRRLEIDKSDGEHIGWINCYERDETEGSTRVGICLPYATNWGKGYGTEALGLLLEYLFAGMGLEEVRMNTWTGNVRMIRAALRAGFEETSRSPHRAAVSIRGEPLERIDLAVSRLRWQSQIQGGLRREST